MDQIELVIGGPGRPEHLDRGYFDRPTVFAGVRNDITIVREAFFGPVLSILPYKNEADAVPLANETVCGLAAYNRVTFNTRDGWRQRCGPATCS